MTAYRSRLPDKLLRVVRSHNDPVSGRGACPEAEFQEQRVRRRYRQIEAGQENMTPVLNDEVYQLSVWTAVTTCFKYMRCFHPDQIGQSHAHQRVAHSLGDELRLLSCGQMLHSEPDCSCSPEKRFPAMRRFDVN